MYEVKSHGRNGPTIVVGDFNIQLSIMNRTIQKIEIEGLNNAINQLDSPDMYSVQ